MFLDWTWLLRREFRARTRLIGGSAILDVFDRRGCAKAMLLEARVRRLVRFGEQSVWRWGSYSVCGWQSCAIAVLVGDTYWKL